MRQYSILTVLLSVAAAPVCLHSEQVDSPGGRFNVTMPVAPQVQEFNGKGYMYTGTSGALKYFVIVDVGSPSNDPTRVLDKMTRGLAQGLQGAVLTDQPHQLVGGHIGRDVTVGEPGGPLDGSIWLRARLYLVEGRKYKVMVGFPKAYTPTAREKDEMTHFFESFRIVDR